MNLKINKNISVWRGDSTPPTIYHLWIKGDNSQWLYEGEEWVNINQKGVPGGCATLDESGKIPSEQLPSYVDDVVEYENFDSLPEEGEKGKIYVTTDNDNQYRWSGSTYIKIGHPLELGEEADEAYPGNKGKELSDNLDSHNERLMDLEDKVFPLTISVSGGGTFEKGISRTITVSWTVKKGDQVVDAESTTVNDSPVEGTSKQFTDVSETTTYTVKATYQSKQVSGSTKATFIAPMYFGFARWSSAADGLNITSLTKQAIKTSPNGSYSLNNPTTGYYLWLCVPNSMTINKVTSSGFDVPMEASTSGSTSVDTYKCYRSSSQINEGVMNIVIS